MAKGIPTSSCTPCIDCSHQHILVPALTSSCTPRVDCSHADICTSRFDILHTSPCTPYVDCSPVARIVLVESTIRLHPALRSSPAHACIPTTSLAGTTCHFACTPFVTCSRLGQPRVDDDVTSPCTPFITCSRGQHSDLALGALWASPCTPFVTCSRSSRGTRAKGETPTSPCTQFVTCSRCGSATVRWPSW